MSKRTKKSVSKRIRRPQLQKLAPSEQLIEQDAEGKPGHVPSRAEMEFRKRMQGAILRAGEEFMRIHREEILARAVELLETEG